MRILATGPGRRGTLDQGVGSLLLSHAKDYETKQLLLLYQEIGDGNIGFWTPLMWAARNGKLTKAEQKAMDKIIDRVSDEFEKFGSTTPKR